MASTKTSTKTTKKVSTKKRNRPLQALKDARRREKTANPSVEGYNAALDTLLSIDIASNEEKLKQLEKKPARGRPRVNKIMPDKTRSVTLPRDLWQIIGLDAEKEIRSANGQIEWVLRKHYNYHAQDVPAQEPAPDLTDLFDDSDEIDPELIKQLKSEGRQKRKQAKANESKQ
jgi:hypothetical protein